jgi:phage terminase large subunit GpA-like protein
MTDMVNIDMYNNLMIENELLKKKNIELEEKLKAYTNTERNKRYYEKNSEKVKIKDLLSKVQKSIKLSILHYDI